MNVPRSTRRCRAAGVSPIDDEEARRLFERLAEAGVAIELSVPFLIRARGWKIHEFCRAIGIHRGYLHALLQGQYAASLDIRFRVRSRLGFDPWRIAEVDHRADIDPMDSLASTPARPPCAASPLVP